MSKRNYTELFDHGDRIGYFTEKLNHMRMCGNPLVAIDDRLYNFNTRTRKYRYKENDVSNDISREEIMDKLKMYILIEERKRKLSKIISKI